jgi:hypothetical protein
MNHPPLYLNLLASLLALCVSFAMCAFGADDMARRIEEGRRHWAFQPLLNGDAPLVRESSLVVNDIDRFIIAELESKGLTLSEAADKATLIRRATLDLTGLPPSPEEVKAFVNDASPTAYETLIDRLLASPHYGERWGRHWLDLARYADTSGFHNDLDRAYAWKYRDYVIKSFNDDKPYARFVAEQLAGDEINGSNEEALIATGFCRNGPSNDDNMGKNAEAIEQYRIDQLDDVISTTATVFMGLTVGCARCHDHKYDPITAKDYYSLMAVFNGTEKQGLPKASKDKDDKEIKDSSKIMALVETRSKVRTTHLLLRGAMQNKGDVVPPAAPAVLTPEPLPFPEPDASAKSSLRRGTLAAWIGSSSNALTWRVLANRVWQYHFGQGIVATPSNFGIAGARPTHPALLDYLAARLIADGGKIKPLHKLILMSATYRQSSQTSEAGQKLDPQNTLLWRMNKQRMEAEVLRDSILSATGKLNPQIGGPGVKPRIRADLLDASQRNKWPVLATEGPIQWRRSVYIYVKRQLLMPMMELFDAPTTTDSCARRTESVVPTQALVLMNDEFVEDQAGFLAQRAMQEVGDDLPRVIARMYDLAMSRPLSNARMKTALAFVQSREKASSPQHALTDLAHVLFNSSEFCYIE